MLPKTCFTGEPKIDHVLDLISYLLFCRRLRCLANYEKANKDLDMARARNKDVAIAENKLVLM